VYRRAQGSFRPASGVCVLFSLVRVPSSFGRFRAPWPCLDDTAVVVVVLSHLIDDVQNLLRPWRSVEDELVELDATVKSRGAAVDASDDQDDAFIQEMVRATW